MNKSSMVTQILYIIAAVLLISIGGFSMTRTTPSLYIALFYLIIGIVILGWNIYYLIQNQKSQKEKVPEN